MASKMEGTRRPVGRGQKVRDAVLAATREELRATGYAALSVEGVARRAGVHKTTVYRRWKDRESLLVEAVSEEIGQDIPIPDTGGFETDLRALGRAFVRWANSGAGRAILATLLSDAVRIPEVADARRRIFQDRLRRAAPVVERAIQRGEIPADTAPGEVLRTLVAPLYMRLLVTGEPIDDAVADRAAAVASAAASAGALGG